jgi:DNA-binding transcriptional ArsR family regulator
MVELSEERLSLVFHALADPSRRQIVRQLANGEQSLSDLAAPLEMSFAGASKHVRVLESAGLVGREIRGRTHYCRLRREALAEAEAWIAFYTRFWNTRLDALESALNQDHENTP